VDENRLFRRTGRVTIHCIWTRIDLNLDLLETAPLMALFRREIQKEKFRNFEK
jgi:hypothetical protein